MKSDDVVGGVKTYEAIIKGDNIPEPGIPESFKVLLKELQSLGLDIRVMEDGEEVGITETSAYNNTDFRSVEEDRRRPNRDDDFRNSGYSFKGFDSEGELVDEPEEKEQDEYSYQDEESFAVFDEEDSDFDTMESQDPMDLLDQED